jgi:hypothetical protein
LTTRYPGEENNVKTRLRLSDADQGIVDALACAFAASYNKNDKAIPPHAIFACFAFMADAMLSVPPEQRRILRQLIEDNVSDVMDHVMAYAAARCHGGADHVH